LICFFRASLEIFDVARSGSPSAQGPGHGCPKRKFFKLEPRAPRSGIVGPRRAGQSKGHFRPLPTATDLKLGPLAPGLPGDPMESIGLGILRGRNSGRPGTGGKMESWETTALRAAQRAAIAVPWDLVHMPWPALGFLVLQPNAGGFLSPHPFSTSLLSLAPLKHFHRSLLQPAAIGCPGLERLRGLNPKGRIGLRPCNGQLTAGEHASNGYRQPRASKNVGCRVAMENLDRWLQPIALLCAG